MAQVAYPRHPTFLQKSASVASLIAWKSKFEAYAGKFRKSPSFKSYYAKSGGSQLDVRSEKPGGSQLDIRLDTKLITESLSKSDYNLGPENDLPPAYPAATTENDDASPPPSFKEVNFAQDFTALEAYLRKKLVVKKKTGNSVRDSSLEAARVFDWLHELPDGNNLEEFLGVYGIPTEGVDLDVLKNNLRKLFQYDAPGSEETPEEPELSEKKDEKCTATDWLRQISSLEELAYGDNLEKWLEGLDVPFHQNVTETKNQIRKYLKIQIEDALNRDPPTQCDVELPNEQPQMKEIEAFVPKWKELIGRMRELKDEDALEKWLDSLEVPHNVPKAKAKAEIRKFFMHETWEDFQGKSIIHQEHSLAKMLWEKFENSGVMKQVAMVAGTTAALGLIAVLSTTMLAFAFPAVFAVNPFFVEVFAQYFLQRQEVAFNLLNFHNQNAKPLSTAWAKQYVLWKYV